MKTFIAKISLIARDPLLRKRIIFTVAALIVFRVLAAIPIPGVDEGALERFFSTNGFFGLIDIFSGGGLSNLSIVMLGVGPYITASIIMQLLTMMIPKLKALYHEEGEAGRRKFSQYSRILTVPLAMLQAFGFIILLRNRGVVSNLAPTDFLVNVIVIAAGSILLMWIGELITEFGIGNGVSLVIFAGIVASFPQTVFQLTADFDVSQIPLILAVIVVSLLITYGVVTVTEAERPIPITYAKRVRGMKIYGGISTYLPLRVNQAGVIPIIFALSILFFPQLLFNFLSEVPNSTVQVLTGSLLRLFSNPWFYSFFYFVLVFLFTYFYTAVTFDPNSIANNLQKNGAFIPGVRPGPSTAEYISKILTRITLVGAIFLGLIAVLPLAMQAVTDKQYFAIGGTALLIVVSVVLDLMKKVDAQVAMREY